jgi:hypothetical protein
VRRSLAKADAKRRRVRFLVLGPAIRFQLSTFCLLLSVVGGKWLCVVVKYEENDAFVVTAYLTDKPKAGEDLWPTGARGQGRPAYRVQRAAASRWAARAQNPSICRYIQLKNKSRLDPPVTRQLKGELKPVKRIKGS